VPIWKKEQWGAEGAEEGWALAARSVSELADLGGPGERER
jgi:hypothetical protein